MKSLRRWLAFLAALLAPLAFLAAGGESAKPAAKPEYIVYIGTYTTKTKSRGIYVSRYDASSGKLMPIGLAAETPDPSFLAVHPSGKFLYAVNEAGKNSMVSAFALDARSGKLKLLNQLPALGDDPCYISLDKTGKYVLVANYTSGNVVVFPLLPDGRLGEHTALVTNRGATGPNKERQEGPHAHFIEVSQDNRFVFAVDLGLDEVLVYRFDARTGALAPHDPPFVKIRAGSGPRHLAIAPGRKFVYVVSELASTVTTLAYQPERATFREIETVSTLPAGFTGANDAAEIAVGPGGNFLYASNRGHDSIAVFAIDGAKGTLAPVADVPTRGKTPRNFAIDPTGRFLLAANQESDSIVVFRIDAKTGALTPTGQALEVPAPVCVTFVPAE